MATSSLSKSTMYGVSLSNLLSSVRNGAKANKRSRALTLELGNAQLRTLADTKDKMISAGPSEILIVVMIPEFRGTQTHVPSAAACRPEPSVFRNCELRFGMWTSTGKISCARKRINTLTHHKYNREHDLTWNAWLIG